MKWLITVLVGANALWCAAQTTAPAARRPLSPIRRMLTPRRVAVATRPAIPTTRPLIATTRPILPATRPAALQAKIDALLKQLGDDDWKRRQDAQDKLVEIGEDAIPDLRKLQSETAEDEVRIRVEAALKLIESNDANGPTRITLHMKDVKLAQVLPEIEKQAKVKVGFENQPIPDTAVFSIDVDRQPFWLVLKEIADKTGCGPAPYYSNARDMITMSPGTNFSRFPGQVAGCFYVTPTYCSRNHSIDYSNPANASVGFSLQMAIYIDPKLKVLRNDYQLNVQQLVDEKGNALAVPQGVGGMGYSSGPGFRRDLNVQLAYKPDIGKKIAHLKGAANFLVLSKSESWELANVLTLKDQVRNVPFGKCTVKAVTKSSDDQYKVEVVIDNPPAMAGQAEAAGDYSTVQQCMRLVDAAGRSYMVGGGGSSGSPTRREHQYYFYRNRGGNAAPGDPAKLIWDIPLETREITVPIEFKDLPLP